MRDPDPHSNMSCKSMVVLKSCHNTYCVGCIAIPATSLVSNNVTYLNKEASQ